MNVQALLDSKSFHAKLNALVKVARKKRSTDEEIAVVLEPLVEAIMGREIDNMPQIRNEKPTIEIKPEPQFELFNSPEQAGLPKDYDPFAEPDLNKPVELPKVDQKSKREEAKELLKGLLEAPHKGEITLPENFPVPMLHEPNGLLAELKWRLAPVDNALMPWAVLAQIEGAHRSDGWRLKVSR
jgi:hypothetical protein